jgi:hypothetical protein
MKETITKQYLLGSSLINIIRLLLKVKFRVSFKYIPRLLFILFVSFCTFPLFVLERIIDFFVLRKVEIKPPIFIIGHWRSGTTHLQNILCKDDQFGFITTLQATTAPYMFLSHKLLRKFGSRLLWKKRPVDNMKLDIDYPQEEEYAMANLSHLSMYHSTVFPQNRELFIPYSSFKTADIKDTKRWIKQYTRLLKKITWMNGGKQLILKNPCNTYRIRLLKQMFSKAKFIYLERSVDDVFASMTEMYNTLFSHFQLQSGNGVVIEQTIYELYKEMIQEFELESQYLNKKELIKIQYEKLVEKPEKVIKLIYHQLRLHSCVKARKKISDYIDEKKNFKRTEKELTEIGAEKVALLKKEFDIY